jgi:hypothetical protein
MPYLVKYVVVLASGGWLDMADRYQDAKAVSDRYPGTHVERWTYPERPDGTHGEPIKARC